MEFNIYTPLILGSFALLGLLVVWVAVPLIQKVTLRRVREARMDHTEDGRAISRLGGVALAAAFVMIALEAAYWFPAGELKTRARVVIFCGSIAMFLLGFWDDLKPLGARKKLCGQILIAVAVGFSGLRIERFQIPWGHGAIYNMGLSSWVVTVVWLVAMTNIINLIDGIDGLAGGIGMMMMGLLVYLGFRGELYFPILCAAGMFGALLGFLRYNFPPAKIYMGDGGAYFLGFLIGVLTLVNSQKGTVVAALIAPLFALALPILDVLLAIVRRGTKGLPIFRPDRRHIHHKLLASGFSRRRTLLTLYAVSSVCLLMAFSVFWSQGRLVPILFGCMFLLFLVAARSLGLVRDWLSPDGTLSNVMLVRKETRYALSLASWLELEAERCATPAELWSGFVFLAGKLGFARVQFVLEQGEPLVWARAEKPGAGDLQVRTLPVSLGNIKAVEFAVEKSTMPLNIFEHLSDLACEAWVKAALRWEEVRRQPIQVDSQPSAQKVS
jgi:UDP-GlcNAc:undecaprenyl-phosphate GlcNAc-1-phosphate transferase